MRGIGWRSESSLTYIPAIIGELVLGGLRRLGGRLGTCPADPTRRAGRHTPMSLKSTNGAAVRAAWTLWAQ